VRVELRSYFGFRISFQRLPRLKLNIAMLTDANSIWWSLHNPKISRSHGNKFPTAGRRLPAPWDFKLHHYPILGSVLI
jgi:hypothetical protein